MARPGRPSSFTRELGHLICRRLLEGETLRAICQGHDMPADSTVRLWVLDNVEGFAEQYARARMVGYQTMADGLIEIADNPETDAAAVNRDRLKIDTRKWLLAKALPKIYGDRVTADVDHNLKADAFSSPLELARGIAFVLAMGTRQMNERDRSP